VPSLDGGSRHFLYSLGEFERYLFIYSDLIFSFFLWRTCATELICRGSLRSPLIYQGGAKHRPLRPRRVGAGIRELELELELTRGAEA